MKGERKMRTVCAAGPWHGSTLATPCPRCHRENARMVDDHFQRVVCLHCGLLVYFDEIPVARESHSDE